MSGLLGRKQRISNSETAVGALRLQSSAQGTPIPLVIGTSRVAPALLDYFDFAAIPHTETQETGGKGGGGATISNTSYTYTTGVILAMCAGPSAAGNAAIGAAWKNRDVTDAATLGLTTFAGNASQTAWSYMTTAHPSQAEAYRGIVYGATAALDLGGSAGLPQLNFEVTGLGGSGDVNVASAVNIVLTGEGYACGWNAAKVDLADWSDYCTAANLAVAPAYTTQRAASEVLAELALIGNAGPVWSDGKLKFRAYADGNVGSYAANLTPVATLTYDDMLGSPGEPAVTIKSGREADRKNVVRLNIRDRANDYQQATVVADDLAHIEVHGERAADPRDLLAICELGVGRRVAQLILQRGLYLQTRYSFRASRRFARLEPMDIVALTDPLSGLDAYPVRLLEVEMDARGALSCVAEDVGTGAAVPSTYSTQAASGSTPSGATAPGDTYDPVIIQPPLALSGSAQIWLGAQGGDEWGGAQVWVSVDGGTSYGLAGTIIGAARYGTTGSVSAVADPDTSSTITANLSISRGVLADASQEAADAYQTLCWLDGEVIGYSAATLVSGHTYDLDTYIRRGLYGTAASSHSSGSEFLRLDSAVAKFPISTTLYGTTIHIKLLSFNRQGGGLQSLADVSAHTFAVQPQAATGAGFGWVLDRSSTTVADPGAGKMRLNAANLSATTTLVLDQTTTDGANMATYFSGLGQAGSIELRAFSDPGAWAAYTYTAANSPTGYQTFTVSLTAKGAEPADGDTLLFTFFPSASSSGNGSANYTLTINDQTANYTVALADFNAPTLLRMTDGNARTITVPSNANAAITVGRTLLVERGGNGTVTLVPQANVAIYAAGNLSLRARYSTASLIKMAADEWLLAGDIDA